jgi:hypothetical protein
MVKTTFGGIISILTAYVIIAYAGQKLNVMFSKQSTVSSLESTISDDKISSLYNINFTDTNILLYYRVVGKNSTNL